MLNIFLDPNLQSITNSIIASVIVNIGSTTISQKFKPSFEKSFKLALKDICKELKPKIGKNLKNALSKKGFASNFFEFQRNGKPIDIALFEKSFKSVLGESVTVKNFFNQCRIHISNDSSLSNQLAMLFNEQILNGLNFLLKELQDHRKESHKKTLDELQEIKRILEENNEQQKNIPLTIGYTEPPQLPNDFVNPAKSLHELELKLHKSKTVLIYGPPGAGKSLIAAKVAYKRKENSLSFFWFRFEKSLTDFNSFKNNLLTFLQNELHTESTNIVKLLSKTNALLVFDDFQKTKDEKTIQLINTIINLLSSNYTNSSLIITSRTNGNLPVSNYTTFNVQGLAENEANDLLTKKWKLELDEKTVSKIIKTLNAHPLYLNFFYEWYIEEKPDNEKFKNYILHAPKEDSQLQLYLITELFNALGGEKSNKNKLLMATAFYRIPETEDFLKKLYKYLNGKDFALIFPELRHQRGLILYSKKQNRFYLHDLLSDFYYNLIEKREDLHNYCAKMYRDRRKNNESWINNIESSHHFLKAKRLDKSAEIIAPILFTSISFGYFGEQIYKLLSKLVNSKLNKVEIKLSIVSNFAHLLSKKGEWDKAIEFYNKSLDGLEKVDDIHGMTLTFNNLGLVYKVKGERGKGQSY